MRHAARLQTICSLTTPTCWDLHLFEAMKYMSGGNLTTVYIRFLPVLSESFRTNSGAVSGAGVHRVKVVPQKCADSPSPNTTSSYWFLRNRSASQVKKDPLSRKCLVIDSLFVEIAHDDTKLKKSDSSSVNSWGSRQVSSPIHRNLNLLHQPEPAELPNSRPRLWYYRHPYGLRLWSHGAATETHLMFNPNSRTWMQLHESSKFPSRVFMVCSMRSWRLAGSQVATSSGTPPEVGLPTRKPGGLHPKWQLCAPMLSKTGHDATHSPLSLVSVSINEIVLTGFCSLRLKMCSVPQTLT